MIDFNVAKKTQLRQKGELDLIFGVTYAMVNAYLGNRAFPRGKNRTRASVAVGVLNALLEQGKLPFAGDKTPESRAASVLKIKQHVDNRL